MKYFASLYILILIAATVFFPRIALAETNVNISNNEGSSKTNVNVTTNTGENTICENGRCTTTKSGEGKSTVCVNGKCYSSEDGNLKVESENGNTKVNINNKSATISSAESNNNINTSVNVDTYTSNDKASKAAQDKKNQIKKQIADQRNALQIILDNIRNLLKSLRFF